MLLNCPLGEENNVRKKRRVLVIASYQEYQKEVSLYFPLGNKRAWGSLSEKVK